MRDRQNDRRREEEKRAFDHTMGCVCGRREGGKGRTDIKAYRASS